MSNNTFYGSKNTSAAGTHIDKVYVYGSCELLIRRPIDTLLAEDFRDEEIPGPIRAANI